MANRFTIGNYEEIANLEKQSLTKLLKFIEDIDIKVVAGSKPDTCLLTVECSTNDKNCILELIEDCSYVGFFKRMQEVPKDELNENNRTLLAVVISKQG